MSSGPGQDPSGDDVGSVGEEAAKLLGALSDWAREQGAAPGGGDGGGLGGLAGQAAAAAREVADHVDTGATECSWCPLCRAVHVMRTPEVRDPLTAAATSLMQAAAGFLAATGAQSRPTRDATPDVEHIDLDGDAWPEEER